MADKHSCLTIPIIAFLTLGWNAPFCFESTSHLPGFQSSRATLRLLPNQIACPLFTPKHNASLEGSSALGRPCQGCVAVDLLDASNLKCKYMSSGPYPEHDCCELLQWPRSDGTSTAQLRLASCMEASTFCLHLRADIDFFARRTLSAGKWSLLIHNHFAMA